MFHIWTVHLKSTIRKQYNVRSCLKSAASYFFLQFTLLYSMVTCILLFQIESFFLQLIRHTKLSKTNFLIHFMSAFIHDFGTFPLSQFLFLYMSVIAVVLCHCLFLITASSFGTWGSLCLVPNESGEQIRFMVTSFENGGQNFIHVIDLFHRGISFHLTPVRVHTPAT